MAANVEADFLRLLRSYRQMDRIVFIFNDQV